MKKSAKYVLTAASIGAVIALSGCKPYDKPEFIDIQPNETAFLIPLEGKTSDQSSFDSEQFLQQSQIATKRIQITHRWVKTGRMPGKGEYKDTIAVIKVDRSPETREWTSESKQGVKVRSKDGIGFTVGVSATSSIEVEDSAKFLYKTSGSKTLATVMDSEVRNRIETKLIEEFAKSDMTFINANKGVIMETVSKDIVQYFKKERGITISNLGYKGDIVFDDPKVQEALNTKFTALQEQEAQQTRNKTALNNALNEIQVKENEAKAKIKEAEGTAEANAKVQASLTPEVLQQQWIEAWKAGGSQVPQYIAGPEASQFVQIPMSK